MNLHQHLANFKIGLRAHSPRHPRYLSNMVKRRLRCGLHLDHLWPGGWSPRPILWVDAIPTYRCNLECKMCFQRNDEGAVRWALQDQEFSPDQWKLIIDRVAQFAPTILWIGGEVLIYPRIVELLAYSKRKGLKVLIVTNGFFLANVAEKLVEIGVDLVTVSIDGSETLHNAIRQNSQAFTRAVEGIKAVLAVRQARRSSLPIVTINHVITRHNYRQIFEFVTFARELGVDVVQFLGLIYLDQTTMQCHREVLRSEFSIEAANIDALDNSQYASGIDTTWLQEQINTLRETSPGFPALRFCPSGFEDYIEAHYGPDGLLPLAHQRCSAPWQKMTIQPNGDVIGCCKLPNLYTGNVLNEDLESIWNGQAFRRFRQRIKQGPLPGCIRCGWLSYR